MRSLFKSRIISACLLAAIVATPDYSYQEEIHYRNVKLENCECHIGIVYTKARDKNSIAVSAVATGKGAEFRKWNVSSIRLVVDGDRIRPDSEERFYVTKESLFRVPAAVLFAAIGIAAGVNTGGSGLEKGVAAAGLGLGMGLLVLAAKGEINGTKSVFTVNKELDNSIKTDRDFIEITAEDEGMHLKETFKIALMKPFYAPGPSADYAKMSEAELSSALNSMRGRLAVLEEEQSSYRYGSDPEYDIIQRKIEDIQAERGIAYMLWLKKKEK